MIRNFQEIISLAQKKERIRLLVAAAQDESSSGCRTGQEAQSGGTDLRR